MDNQFTRNCWALGSAKQRVLKTKSVLVIGVGGVGGVAIEILARMGVGEIALCDPDVIDVTNLNRQLIAVHQTIGQYKVDAWEKRILEINPNCKVTKFAVAYSSENRDRILSPRYDYIIDAFDKYKQKADLAIACSLRKIKVIHSMGAANRFDPTKFYVTTLDRVKGDYLAKGMQKELKLSNKDIRRIKVVCSSEIAKQQTPPASLPFTPLAAGNLIAYYVIDKMLQLNKVKIK